MKNVKLGVRLLASMGVTLVLMIILTVMAILGMNSERSGYEEILSGSVAITDAVQESQREVNSIARQLRDMALFGYDTNTVSQIEASLESIDASLDAIRGTGTAASEYISAVEEWRGAFSDIDAALSSGNLDRARSLLQTQCTPLLEAAVADGNALMDQVQSQGDDAVAAVGQDLQRNTILLVVLLVLACVVGLNVIQGLISPAVDSVKRSALTRGVEAIPGVGDAIGGVTEVALGTAVLVKNGIGVTGAVICVALCVVPLVQIGCIALLYKLAAALIQPVSDQRVAGCIESVGDGCRLLMRVVFTTGLLFLLTIVVVAALTSL